MIDGIVAIVGRPNVGKSTLFNRMTRSDAAIVDDQPGVTRDRIYGTVWLDEDKVDGFVLVDTGGFETDDYKFQPFAENLVWRQTEAAIRESDMVMLLLDGKSGLHPHDHELVRFLEKIQKPWIGVVNKVDGPEQTTVMWEFYELGLDELVKVSAAHNRGVGDLKETLLTHLKALPGVVRGEDHEGATKIAIVGRPNAGKSSILNRIAGEERALVSPIAGTTRDCVDTPITYQGEKFVLVDTAGIRRKSKIKERVESMSVIHAIRAIERADVVLIVIDALAGLTDQDMRLAQLAADRHRPVAFVINKWDLVPEKEANTARDYTANIHRAMKTLAFAPVVFVSCLANQRVHKLIGVAQELTRQAARRVETSRVNAALRHMVLTHTPALIKGKTKRVKFYFATQVAVSPPSFVIKSNVYNEIQESYIRYMTSRFRKVLGFDNVPIRLFFRPKNTEKLRGELEAEMEEAERAAGPAIETDAIDRDFDFEDVIDGEGFEEDLGDDGVEVTLAERSGRDPEGLKY